MRRRLLFLACSSFVLFAHAQDISLSLSALTVPEALKKDANAVYRLDEGLLDIRSSSAYTFKVHQVVTLLNARAAYYLDHHLGVDKFRKVEKVNIRMFDALGHLTGAYDKKDFETGAAYDGISLVTDDKVMHLKTPAPGYPCTADIQYTINVSGYIELPNWFVNNHDASTEVFRFEVRVPGEIDIRQRTLNFDITPKVETEGALKHYVWEAKNIQVKKLEADGFETALYLPQVEVAPNAFEYDGYKGSFKSWKDFGQWNYQLYEEKNPFAEPRLSEIRDMVRSAGTEKEKIAILYHHLQKNMRYVSIQLGIGGFKPFAVRFVDDKRYGDCKALTNYMRYLLKVAGIKSYPALINAGTNKIPADPQFPSDPFNHVILCVPGAKDTTWLECTSNTNKAGELGSFTENRKALLLTEEGGVLVNTPASSYHSNRVVIQNEVQIGEDGGGQVLSQISSWGDAASFYEYVKQLSDDEQREALIRYLQYKEPEGLEMQAGEGSEYTGLHIKRSYPKLYDFSAGNKYFFPLCLDKLGDRTLQAARRETEYVFSYPYEKTDSTIFLLPAGFSAESIPADKELATELTLYKRSFVWDKAANKLLVVSCLALKSRVIPPARYGAVVQFFKEVAELEDENLILLKQ